MVHTKIHFAGRFISYFLLYFTCINIVTSQQNQLIQIDSIEKEIIGHQISSSIQIDGILDEQEWSKAKPSPRFVQINPIQGELPNQDTEIKILYNKKYLYLGIICHDSLGKKAIRATDFKRDFNFQTHDLVNIGFDAFNDKRNSMTFAVNPYGVQRDYLSFDAIYYDLDWDGVWEVRTTRTDKGWIAEIAIPWQTLRYSNKEGIEQSWGLNVYRNRRMTNEISAFSEFPRSFGASRMDYAGKLSNLKPPPPSTNIRIQPYVLAAYERFENDPDRNNGISGTEDTFKIGGDVKWAINSNSVLDITVNTDFAQVDLDRPVNNTSRFNVFFPEKRQFFLENAALFAFNARSGGNGVGGSMRIQPFFSRRIGLGDDGRPAPIAGGGRYVYRSVERNFGGILMRQQENNDTPATNYFVGRFSENIGEQSRIGGLVTIKNQPNNTNIMGTIDGFFRYKKAHSLNTLFSYSKDTQFDDQGVSGIAQYYYTTNDWKAWWTQSIVTENFKPEMGFVSRSNIIGTTPGVIRFFRGEKLPFKKWIRAYEPSISAEFYHEASSGKLIERQLSIRPLYLNLQSGGYFGYQLSFIHQNLVNSFSPLDITIPIGEYNYARHSLFASTDPSKKLSLKLQGSMGSYFNGELKSSDIKLKFVPIPHISLLAGYNRNKFIEVGENLVDKKVDLISLEGRFALNPRIQLTGYYYQNTQNNKYNYNIRFSWEYKPLSFIYLVFNQLEFDNEFQMRQVEQQSIMKVSYLKQF